MPYLSIVEIYKVSNKLKKYKTLNDKITSYVYNVIHFLQC